MTHPPGGLLATVPWRRNSQWWMGIGMETGQSAGATFNDDQGNDTGVTPSGHWRMDAEHPSKQ